jgi:hypothetical protein
MRPLLKTALVFPLEPQKDTGWYHWHFPEIPLEAAASLLKAWLGMRRASVFRLKGAKKHAPPYNPSAATVLRP